MDEPKVILVMLRQPRLDNPTESRTDPLWEFGSFGCTGCHRKNLLNPKKLAELTGVRFGFAQNGPLGVKLVHLTPPVILRHHGKFGEAKWSPAEMALTYESAPILVNNRGGSDIPSLLHLIRDVHRSSPVAQFSSKFRSRRLLLPAALGRELVGLYKRYRQKSGRISRSYVDALPCMPPRIDRNREATYRELLGEVPSPKKRKRSCAHRVPRC